MKLRFKIFRKRPSIKTAVFKSALFIGILLYCVAIAQLFLTLSLSIYLRPDYAEAYMRNVSSILCFILLGQFLYSWCVYNVDAMTKKWQMRLFKTVTVAGGILAFLKGLFSIYFTLNQAHKGITVAAYYISDIVAWLGVSAFFWAYYYFKLCPHHGRERHIKNFKTLTLVLVIIFFLKAVTTTFYLSVRYNRFSIAWTYFLYDFIAWIFLASFFAAYHHSDLVSKTLSKSSHDKSKESIYAAMEAAAKVRTLPDQPQVMHDGRKDHRRQ